MPFFAKQLRLPRSEYRGPKTYFVTICTENRTPFFSAESTGRWLLAELLVLAASYHFTPHAYCLMPDHLHFLAEGQTDSSDLVKFVDRLKQATAYEFMQAQGKRLWQRRYYDHILRRTETIEGIACYIWWNPVRKGLCDNPRDYPLSGSPTIDWMTKSATPTDWLPPWKKSALLHNRRTSAPPL